ncbi:hypothetical protein BZZ01_20575 [Nostocales cyanobacterium HT-58-2]|nr:hypothetical protein BZZ01_20575 [Nostocales cyanobacterium HT-58-2]
MKPEDNNGYKKVKIMILAGVATAAIVLGIIALVLRKTSFLLPSSTIQPTTVPSLSPTTKQDDDKHDNDDHDNDDDDQEDDDD